MTEEAKIKVQSDGSGDGAGGRKNRIGAGSGGDAKRVVIDKELTVKELSSKLEVSEAKVIGHLFYEMNLPRTLNQIIELEFAHRVARAFGFEVCGIR